MLKTNLPVLIVRNVVLFPYTECKFEFDNIDDKKIISLAENYFDGHLLVVSSNEDNYTKETLPRIGIVAQVKFKLDMPNGLTRVSLKGVNRVNVHRYNIDDNLYDATVSPIVNKSLSPVSELASARTLKNLFNEYIELKKGIGNSILAQIDEIHSISKLTDIIVSFVPMELVRKIKYIEETNAVNRVEMLIDDLNYELSLLNYEQELDFKVERNLEESQKEYILREKIKVINEELGISVENEVDELEDAFNNFDGPSSVKSRLKEEINRYKLCNSNSPEVGIIKNYIDTLLSLPWNKSTEDTENFLEVKEKLNNSHYGLDDTKLRILEYIATKEYTHNQCSPILCLVGPPGVGKTSIAKAISNALNRKCVKISVGGINDAAEITGHRRAYVGAAPGKIISGIKKAGVNNPVFIIDEIDKMTKDIKGDPASSLLEVLDKEQNSRYVDHFLEEEFDLSKVMFILTANYIDKVPSELKDRLEIIELTSYTTKEKLNIAKGYIIPKLKEEYELFDFDLLEDTILKIINDYTKESGVRELERLLRKMCRKIIYTKLVNNEKVYDTNNDLEELLGKKKYLHLDNYENVVGCVNGLSCSVVGGNILKVESVYHKGNGNILLTGLLGDMVKESITIAFTYLKSHCNLFNIRFELLNENDFHVHLPSSGLKKDGPSAGVTVVTSIISLIKKLKISNEIAMTGELTLSGKILPVGSIKEKIIASIVNGVKIVYMPKDNMNEIIEYEELYKDKLQIKFVDNYKEIFRDLFEK